MRNRLMTAILAMTLTLSGCACANSKEKKDEKVVHRRKKRKNRNKMQSINLKKMRVNLLLIRDYPVYIQMRNFLRMRMIIFMITGKLITGL